MAKGCKLVATWEYRRNGVSLDVPVKMVDKQKMGRMSRDSEGVYFSVSLDTPVQVYQTGTDINALQKLVFDEIESKLSIGWQPVLLLTVDGHRRRLYAEDDGPATPDTECAAESAFEMKWERYQIATVGKKKLHRAFNNYYEPMDGDDSPAREVWDKARDGWPELDNESRWRGRGGEKRVMIPDTPENRAALEAIAEAMQAAKDKLRELLGEQKINDTLARIAASGLPELLKLPGPPAK